MYGIVNKASRDESADHEIYKHTGDHAERFGK